MEQDVNLNKREFVKAYRYMEVSLGDEMRKNTLLYNPHNNNSNLDEGVSDALEEKEQLDKGHRNLTCMIESGTETMLSLDRQKTLQGTATRRMKNIFNDLGQTRLMVRNTHERSRTDEILVCALQIFTLIMIYFTYYWLRHWVRGAIWSIFTK